MSKNLLPWRRLKLYDKMNEIKKRKIVQTTEGQSFMAAFDARWVTANDLTKYHHIDSSFEIYWREVFIRDLNTNLKLWVWLGFILSI